MTVDTTVRRWSWHYIYLVQVTIQKRIITSKLG